MTEIPYSMGKLPADQIQENRSVGQQKIIRLKYKEKRRMKITENRLGDIGDIANGVTYSQKKKSREGEGD